MDEQRKKAYRYLLYHAMLDIRPIAWIRFGFFSFLHPFRWRETRQYIRRAGIIANWLHNLAFFSADDFDHFDEDRFWQDFQSIEKRYPNYEMTKYRNSFDQRISSADGHNGNRASN